MIDSELDDFYSIFTKVKVGKSYKSKGWALSKKDIDDIIPVDKYEGQCHIEINNIIVPAQIMINPRLFYRSKNLSKHLEELFNLDSNMKVPMEIRLKKEQIYSNFIKKYDNSKPLKFIELDLTVGKSFNTKMWRINNDITSDFIPLVDYSNDYIVIVDNILSSAVIDIQVRIRYGSKKLSDYLKKLYDIDPTQKVSAKIIFDEDLVVYDLFNKFAEGNNVNHNILEFKKGLNDLDNDKNLDLDHNQSKSNNTLDFYLKSKKDSKGEIMSDEIVDNKCPICGRKLPKNIKKELLEISDKYSIKCMNCLRRIYALEYFYLFNEKSLSNYIQKDHMRNKLNLDNFDFVWDLFIKFDMLKQVGSSFKLVGNYEIEEKYGPMIKKDDGSQGYQMPRLVLEPETVETPTIRKCVSCGKILREDEYELCSDCSSKDFTYKEIYNVLPYFSAIATISEEDLPDDKFSSIQKKRILSNLEKNRIIFLNMENTYSLDFEYLIDFIDRWDHLENNIIFDSKNNNLNIVFLPNYVFSNESLFDTYMNWDEFTDFVEIKDSSFSVMIKLKDHNKVISSQREKDSLSAKIIAALYLKDLGIIKLLNREDIKKFGISRN